MVSPCFSNIKILAKVSDILYPILYVSEVYYDKKSLTKLIVTKPDQARLSAG